MRSEYDDLGRMTAQIRNYVNGTPSGPTGDDDVHTRYVYADGLQTKMWVDLDGDDVEDADDQVTTYVYGTTKGASAGDSEIGTGHLLQKVTYPDSDGASDVVTYAYNAQGQQIWTKDQSGNVIETTYDERGREVHRRATTIDADFDADVKRISTVYDDRGMVDTVTQYDHATAGSGSIVNQVDHDYEDWGRLSTLALDRNSAVTGGELSGTYGYYDVAWTYAKATTGRNTVRRATMTLPDARTITYDYQSTNDLHDADMSRVTRVKIGAKVIATYAYNGVGTVVGTDYPEPDLMWNLYGSTSGSYPDLDRFGRVTSSRWTKDLTTDVDLYDLEIAWDRNGNVTRTEDHVHGGFDVAYAIDDLDRLTDAQEGTWNSGTSSITSETRQQTWTLDQVGNWDHATLDLDGDGTYTGTDEYDDDRTHNDVNELTARDTDDDGADDETLAYDEVGNLIDDGADYDYVYDVFGRLREVKNRSTAALVAEYVYDGLGRRIGVHQDTDTDGDVDGSDVWFHFVYDDQWRVVGVFRESDDDPKEQFVYHAAGQDGYGGSSYIDLVILRDRDANSGITSAADGTLEERRYYCQNWRADVSALVAGNGQTIEWVKYSSYGIPFALPGADTDSDGDCDAADITQIQTWIDGSTYDVRGDVDASDKTTAQNSYQGTTLGWNVLSGIRNRKGYAGYEWDPVVHVYHVRHRVLDPELGRWTRRDPRVHLAFDGHSDDGTTFVAASRHFAVATSHPNRAIADSTASIALCSGCRKPTSHSTRMNSPTFADDRNVCAADQENDEFEAVDRNMFAFRPFRDRQGPAAFCCCRVGAWRITGPICYRRCAILASSPGGTCNVSCRTYLRAWAPGKELCRYAGCTKRGCRFVKEKSGIMVGNSTKSGCREISPIGEEPFVVCKRARP